MAGPHHLTFSSFQKWISTFNLLAFYFFMLWNFGFISTDFDQTHTMLRWCTKINTQHRACVRVCAWIDRTEVLRDSGCAPSTQRVFAGSSPCHRRAFTPSSSSSDEDGVARRLSKQAALSRTRPHWSARLSSPAPPGGGETWHRAPRLLSRRRASARSTQP